MTKNTLDSPYLSIVVTARNDNHGGDMLKRIQAFVESLVRQCRKFNLDAELIVVEWNPLKDKKRIYDEISWPYPLDPLTIRFIEVPSAIHNALENADKFPLFQMIAKNVGIRRAKGQFVLATNIDIIFSDELVWFLSQKMLEEKHFYRIDRYDVGKRSIPASIGAENLIKYCESNIIRINSLEGTIETTSHSGVRFDKAFTSLPKQDLTSLAKHECSRLHTNACGDFTLLSTQYWHKLKAYPELQKWSIFIDGLMVHMAYAAGIEQIILTDPMRIYHIEHDLGWALTQETTKTRPSLDYNKEYRPWCDQMIKEMKPITTNDDNWGFAGNGFPEKIISETNKDSLIPLLKTWIHTIAEQENRLYYRDQTSESLFALVKAVEKYKPTRVIELGTLSGLSLRTWLVADPNIKVTAVDLSFSALMKSKDFLPFDQSRVTLVEQNILQLDFERLWNHDKPIILYVDAHDLPGVPIINYVLVNALPSLPKGSLVMVDDVWYSPITLNADNVSDFFSKIVANEIDSLQCFDGYYAPYWKGGSFLGFMEVIPLMEWVNKNKIELDFKPGIKSVAFSWGGANA